MPKARSETYEYDLPEGYTMSESLRQKLDALVDEAGMDEVLAQRFVDLHVELVEEYAAKLDDATEPAGYQPEGTVDDAPKAKYQRKQ